jgi:hypothetical protein
MRYFYKEWKKLDKPKIFCKCGCNQEIIIKENHKYNGIPEYISGHNKAHLRHYHSEETKKKWSEKRKGKKLSKETKRKLSEKNNGKNHWNYGKHHSDETKQKMREKKLGRKLSEETKIKISEANKGRIKTKEERKKLSALNLIIKRKKK